MCSSDLDRARVGPTTKTSDEISIICLFRLILQANPCFVLSCGIRVASMPSVDSIPSPNGVLILLCEYQSFLLIKIGMSILYNRYASLQVNPILSIFARSILSSLQCCLFHSSQVVFVFPALPLFFFKDSDFLIKYPFYSCEVSSFFSINVLTRWFS